MKAYSVIDRDTADYVAEKLFSGHLLGFTRLIHARHSSVTERLLQSCCLCAYVLTRLLL